MFDILYHTINKSLKIVLIVKLFKTVIKNVTFTLKQVPGKYMWVY